MNQTDQYLQSPLKEELNVFELKYAPTHLYEKMGGKASTLAQLLKLSFPVPPGVSVLTSVLNQKNWDFIREWAQVENIYPVAVRSSAQGEDGSEVSYAGQFKTFLNISNESEMATAIQNCFDSINLTSSNSYAVHFNREKIPMRVLIQKMITPVFSGVYFSHDPRNQNPGWIIEAVEGTGEKLVSAQVTPYRFFQEQSTQNIPNIKWKSHFTNLISEWALRIEQTLGYRIDMEWAIDQNNEFWILQVRPITTQQSNLFSKDILNEELDRLLSHDNISTLWDGHSFAELSGVASEFTYQLWATAFKPGKAFDQALTQLGYSGLKFKNESNDPNPNSSLLDHVFGRSYLNLKKMEPVYFGESPYKIMPNPRPHLEFDIKKLSPKLLLKGPSGIFQMLKVAWKIQTQRGALAQKAQECLHDQKYDHLSSFEIYSEALKRNPKTQFEYLNNTINDFTTKYLFGSFLITLLIESTVQGLLALLSKDMGPEKAMNELQHFLGENLNTATSDMSKNLIEAQHSVQTWNAFISRYGHRGLGELELSRERWIEHEKINHQNSNREKLKIHSALEDRMNIVIENISSIRKSLFLQEVKELQKLLKIREDIKMHIMKPYADIRWTLLSIAKNYNSIFLKQEDIFSISFDELSEIIQCFTNSDAYENSEKWINQIKKRQTKAHIFKSVELPMSFSAAQLKNILTHKPTGHSQLLGVSLSPGIVYGIVHKVENPETEDIDNWPENIILVAEATDPGWTPLFAKSKAIIVARGGILSHCAIVAREMGLPAVGEICGAMSLFKEGEYVWVDGINGTIKRSC